WTLVASPQQAVPFLKKRLQPAAPVDTERINRLIKSLDDDVFEVREKATAELKKFGEQAEAALRKALAAGPSAEVRLRLESLLEKLGDPSSSAQRLHALRAVEVLDFIGTPEAQEVLKTLSKGAPEARLTQEAKAALERLGRRATGRGE